VSDTGTAPPHRFVIYMRALARFAVFLAFGPLLGAIIAILADALSGGAAGLLHGLPATIAYSYAFGAVPAAVIGFIVAGRDILSRPADLMLAIGLGGVVGAIWGVYVANEGYGYSLGFIVFIAAVVATLVCWRLTLRLARRTATP
jgi:hypothetical protein